MAEISQFQSSRSESIDLPEIGHMTPDSPDEPGIPQFEVGLPDPPRAGPPPLWKGQPPLREMTTQPREMPNLFSMPDKSVLEAINSAKNTLAQRFGQLKADAASDDELNRLQEFSDQILGREILEGIWGSGAIDALTTVDDVQDLVQSLTLEYQQQELERANDMQVRGDAPDIMTRKGSEEPQLPQEVSDAEIPQDVGDANAPKDVGNAKVPREVGDAKAEKVSDRRSIELLMQYSFWFEGHEMEDGLKALPRDHVENPSTLKRELNSIAQCLGQKERLEDRTTLLDMSPKDKAHVLSDVLRARQSLCQSYVKAGVKGPDMLKLLDLWTPLMIKQSEPFLTLREQRPMPANELNSISEVHDRVGSKDGFSDQFEVDNDNEDLFGSVAQDEPQQSRRQADDADDLKSNRPSP